MLLDGISVRDHQNDGPRGPNGTCQQMLEVGGRGSGREAKVRRGTACAYVVVNGRFPGSQKPDTHQRRYKNRVEEKVEKRR